jgi:TRAP transporter 4TM/12TM fusion protein
VQYNNNESEKLDDTRCSERFFTGRITGAAKLIFLSFSVIGMLVAVYQLFHFELLGVIVGDGYYYLLIALYLPLVFLNKPGAKKNIGKRIPWYDFLFAFMSFVAPAYLFMNSYNIIENGWEVCPPIQIYILGLLLILLVIEAGRRSGGLLFILIVLFFAVFPLYAEYMPGPLEGYSVGLQRLVGFFTMGSEGVTGLPMRVVGNILIGYMLFAVTLQVTGGSQFFLDFAIAFFGGLRGGPAKMSIIASSFFGSISGSSISNVLTTGAITIPTMKKTGYPPHYAGAIEAVASTGGVLMPPIMGVTAFIMAEFLAMPYYKICIAAIIPSFLYFAGLFIQVDAYAAKAGLKGLSKEEIPSIKETLAEGWFHIVSIVFLVWALLYLHWDALAPFWASLILLITCNFNKKTRLSWAKIVSLVEGTGKVLSDLVALLCAIGVIICALSITGVANSFSSEVIAMAHGNVALLLLLGAVASFILGMGMTITACYVFLALILAPALINCGLYPLSVHLFVMYWGMASYITPPVALSAFAGAELAEANPMKTGFKAMQLGIVTYFIPFFFVLNPAIIFYGTPGNIIVSFILVCFAVVFISYSLEGYLPKVGLIPIYLRALLLSGGFCLAFPWMMWRVTGMVIILVAISIILLQKAALTNKRNVS